MTTYAELIKVTNDKFEKEIFHLLLNNQLIHKVDTLVDSSFPKKLVRLELQKESIESKISLLQKYIDEGSKFENFNKGILCDLIFIMAQTTLGYYEIFNGYLEKTLDLNKLRLARENLKFGEMVVALGKYKQGTIFHYDGLRMFFNVNMRNILVHDDWWLDENTEFTFKEPDGTPINLNIGELHSELAGINAIVLAFTENYMKKIDSKNYEFFKKQMPHLFPK